MVNRAWQNFLTVRLGRLDTLRDFLERIDELDLPGTDLHHDNDEVSAPCFWVAVKELQLSYHNGYI